VVIKELPCDKAPGPDGIPAEFYKNCWSLVKKDLVDAVSHFFRTSQLPPQWKSTFIDLVPKVKGPSSAKDYRPTSLCNVCYKIVSKILVNDKSVLHLLVSQEQSAFISERMIMDNVLLAQEILHSMGNRGDGKKMMALKLNMERVYDRMQWDFLRKVMRRFGFDCMFIDLIMGCIQNPLFAVLVMEL